MACATEPESSTLTKTSQDEVHSLIMHAIHMLREDQANATFYAIIVEQRRRGERPLIRETFKHFEVTLEERLSWKQNYRNLLRAFKLGKPNRRFQ